VRACMLHNFLKPLTFSDVERRVSSCRTIRKLLGLWLIAGICGAATVTRADESSDPLFAPATDHASAHAPKPPPAPAFDELVFADGDRVRGHFVEKIGDTVVFQSERFGLLHVSAADAEVILAKMPEPELAPVVDVEGGTGTVTVEHGPFSPREMARQLKQFFGSWHGRFAVSAEALQDARDRSTVSVEARLQRKWKSDEVQLNARYDYGSVDEVVSTDMIRGDGVWRHDFPGKFFGVYRPTLEWNRAYYRGGLPADYLLLQQEVGAGINVFNKETRKLRAGVSENMFNTWVVNGGDQLSQTVESMFAEFEAKLPWRISLTNRGVWYYSLSDQSDGWENRFEINKKLTETLTIGARHEIRYNNPDVRVSDYQRLRVLFGFDF